MFMTCIQVFSLSRVDLSGSFGCFLMFLSFVRLVISLSNIVLMATSSHGDIVIWSHGDVVTRSHSDVVT